MPDLLIGLFSVLIATNQPVVVSNLVPRAAGVSVSVPDKNDPVEKELSKLMAEDDAAEDEIDEWLKNARPAPGGDPDPAAAALQEKIKQRLEKVRRGYEDFLQRHPGNARGHIVFGSFLNDIEDEPGALAHWEKGRDLDPKNPGAPSFPLNGHGSIKLSALFNDPNDKE